MPKDNGGQAFPLHAPVYDENQGYLYASEGMTLRDWFAGKALAGHLSTAKSLDAIITGAAEEDMTPQEFLASLCYSTADDLIKERSKDESKS